MAIKISNSTIIDDSRNIVNAGITSVTSVSIGNTEVISSARQLKNIASLDATTTAAIGSAVASAPNTFTTLNVTGISTFTNGPVFIGAATSTGTASQPLQITGGVYVSGSVGIGTTNPTSKLQVAGDIHLNDGGTYTTTVQTITPTGNRTISFPDATGTIALVAGSSGQLQYNNAGVSAGASTLSIDASGNVAVDTNTLYVDVVNNRVAIGTTSPDALLTVNGIGAFGAGAVTTPSIARTGDLNTGFWFPAADTIAASTGGGERIRVDSSGRILVGTSTANANGGILQLSSGITFPATAVAATDVNTLDDYEEGTWTPTQGAGLTVVGTFSSGGSYIKVGRKILIIGYVSGSTSVVAAAGGILCEGLPFNSVNSLVQAVGSGSNANQSALINVYCNGGTDDIYAVTAMASTTYIYFSISYIVA